MWAFDSRGGGGVFLESPVLRAEFLEVEAIPLICQNGTQKEHLVSTAQNSSCARKLHTLPIDFPGSYLQPIVSSANFAYSKKLNIFILNPLMLAPGSISTLGLKNAQTPVTFRQKATKWCGMAVLQTVIHDFNLILSLRCSLRGASVESA